MKLCLQVVQIEKLAKRSTRTPKKGVDLIKVNVLSRILSTAYMNSHIFICITIMLRTTIATFYRYRSITLFMEIWFNDRFSFRRKLLHVEDNVLK